MITLRSILTDLSEDQVNQVVNADVFAGGWKKWKKHGSSKSLSSKSSSSKSSKSSSSNSSKSSKSSGGRGCYCHCGI